ncbi:MAG: serine hydrolase domain-containing protein [Chloroflexota bacterium]
MAGTASFARNYWPVSGWRDAPAGEHGIDQTYLDRADRYAREEAPQVAAMLVVRHGYVVFERYYSDFGPSSHFSVASVTKSVLSALVGIALRDGLLRSVDQPIEGFFPGQRTLGLTLRHLLTLTAGWPYHDFNHRPDTVAEMLAEPLASKPGERFQYGETPPHLVSAILSQVTGSSASGYAVRELFQPLGIWREASRWREVPGTLSHTGEGAADGLPWKCDAQGISSGGHGLHLTIRDMARFGLLYASSGWWGDRQLLPAEHVAESTRTQSRGGSPMWMPYGWFWWIPKWHRGHAMLAAGYGGQAIYVNSDSDLVIVLASKPASGSGMDDWTVLNRYLIPAITDW